MPSPAALPASQTNGIILRERPTDGPREPLRTRRRCTRRTRTVCLCEESDAPRAVVIRRAVSHGARRARAVCDFAAVAARTVEAHWAAADCAGHACTILWCVCVCMYLGSCRLCTACMYYPDILHIYIYIYIYTYIPHTHIPSW